MNCLMDRTVCDRARLARDPRFDGLFFIGVRSTGIYCRPICPAPAPRPENIVYYPTAAAAAAAGLRPCLRCRPETAPGTPAWNGTSATVARAMNLIRQGALDEGVGGRSGQSGWAWGARHLRRLFRRHIGATPKAIADNQRLLFAKRLVVETDLSITQAALAAGYSSLRRCNAAFRKRIGRTPSQLRRRRPQKPTPSDSGFSCTLTPALPAAIRLGPDAGLLPGPGHPRGGMGRWQDLSPDHRPVDHPGSPHGPPCPPQDRPWPLMSA